MFRVETFPLQCLYRKQGTEATCSNPLDKLSNPASGASDTTTTSSTVCLPKELTPVVVPSSTDMVGSCSFPK